MAVPPKAFFDISLAIQIVNAVMISRIQKKYRNIIVSQRRGKEGTICSSKSGININSTVPFSQTSGKLSRVPSDFAGHFPEKEQLAAKRS